MNSSHRPHVAAVPARHLRIAAGFGLLLACVPACSTAGAVGCASGIAAGVALAGLSAAAAKSDATQQIDVGTAMLGGSLFGAVCGCTAAGVAEGLTKASSRSQTPQWSERVSASEVAPAGASASAQRRLLTARTSLDGLTVTLLGTPESGSKQVALELKRFGSSPEIASCRTLDLELDGQQLHFPVQVRRQTQDTLVAESAQAKVPITAVEALQAAKQSTIRLCGLERSLNVEARSALSEFVLSFSARAPGALAAAVHEPEQTQSAATTQRVGAPSEPHAAP